MVYKHFILTRFNVGLYRCKQKMRSGKVIEPEKWMSHRFNLFERYCVPSIENQTCKHFKWLIVVDDRTPMAHMLRIKGLVDGVNSRIIAGSNFRAAVKGYIKIPDYPVLITSRIDNDDAIHKDYVKDIQEWYDRKKKTGILTYPSGWIWNPKKCKLFHSRYVKNPFTTLIEKCDKKVRTILFHRHTEVVNYYKLHKIEKEHRWLQIVHSENIANHCWGDSVHPSKLIREDYGI